VLFVQKKATFLEIRKQAMNKESTGNLFQQFLILFLDIRIQKIHISKNDVLQNNFWKNADKEQRIVNSQIF